MFRPLRLGFEGALGSRLLCLRDLCLGAPPYKYGLGLRVEGIGLIRGFLQEEGSGFGFFWISGFRRALNPYSFVSLGRRDPETQLCQVSQATVHMLPGLPRGLAVKLMREFPKIGGPYFGVLIIRILLFRVPY